MKNLAKATGIVLWKLTKRLIGAVIGAVIIAIIYKMGELEDEENKKKIRVMMKIKRTIETTDKEQL